MFNLNEEKQRCEEMSEWTRRDNNIPYELHDYLCEAIERWNKALEVIEFLKKQ